MKFTILIPHFREGRTTAYAVSQLLKLKGKHEVDIVIINNSPDEGSIKYLDPFKEQVTIYNYPTDRLQSHGIAFDYAFELGAVKNEWTITIESDGFPTQDNWLDYYEDLINKGYECAGSVLQLSGGTYRHPCGMLVSKTLWRDANFTAKHIPYYYFPNMSMKEGFACHLMVYEKLLNEFIAKPEDYIELADGYKPYYPQLAEKQSTHYLPVSGVFHNGMGNKEESIHTYGLRTIESEAQSIFYDKPKKLINRIGAEPGQWLSWYCKAMNIKTFDIPTEIKWIPEFEGKQQEFTVMENGFTHIWCGSSYLDMKGGEYNDVYEVKKNQIEKLYNSLPGNQKIYD